MNRRIPERIEIDPSALIVFCYSVGSNESSDLISRVLFLDRYDLGHATSRMSCKHINVLALMTAKTRTAAA